MPAHGIPPGVNGFNGTIKIAGVCERDIDLLLLEEFTSETFCAWFIEQALGGSGVRFVKLLSAQRGVTQTTGESDLEVVFLTESQQPICLLIENKIGAAFQPTQAMRYHCRGENYRQQGKCERYVAVLLAPSKYVGGDARDHRGFDTSISYETIQQWFQTQNGLGDRRRYKQALLGAAIQKALFGYQPQEDAAVNRFWQQYWMLCQQIAPSLEMGEPNGKPARATFVHFRPGRLPRGLSIVHKMALGHVDLEFAGHGKKLSNLRAQFGSRLLDGMAIVKATKSGAIRVRVPPVDPAKEFAVQQAAVQQGVSAAKTLLRWYAEGNGSVSPRIGYTS